MARMGAREWMMLLALSGLWGGSFFFYKVLAPALPPLIVALGRVGVAALALNLWLWLSGQAKSADGRLWRAYLVMGLLNNAIPFSLIAFGETRITSGLASILNATTPIFTVIAAHVLTNDERLTAPKAVGVLLGIIGVAILVDPSANFRADFPATGACLAAALSYALAGVFGRRFASLPPLQVAAGQVTASTLVLIPLALAFDRPWTLPMPTAQTWLALLGIGMLCTALAYILYFRILQLAGSTNLLLVTFLLPISALALGALVLGEGFSKRELGGMVVISLGLAALDGRLWRELRAAAGRKRTSADAEYPGRNPPLRRSFPNGRGGRTSGAAGPSGGP